MSEETKKKLEEVIDKIADLASKRQKITRERRNIRDKTSVIRAKLVMEIATAKDDKGKLVYSNEKLREAALTLKLDKNEEFQRLKEKLWELDDQGETLAIEHNRLLDKRTLLFIKLGVLNLISSEAPPSAQPGADEII
jgi:hypothetical protein